MAQGNGTSSRNGRRRPVKGRALLRAAFVHALDKAGASHNAAARWLKKRPSTIRRWLAGTHRMDVEVVIESPRLGRHFCSCLALAERRLMRGR